jgi:hypothetical protein
MVIRWIYCRNRIPFRSTTANFLSGLDAGPASLAPVSVENSESWQVQMIAWAVARDTSQPACVQIAEKAEKFPLVG